MEHLSLGFTILVVAATATAVLARVDLPGGFWVQHPRAVVAALIVVVVNGSIEPIRRFVRDRRVARWARFEDDVRQLLASNLFLIAELAGLDIKQVGVHVFVVQWKWKWGFPLRRVQRQVARLKLSAHPPRSGIEWTKGKGAIGLCWAENAAAAVDLFGRFEPYLGATKEEWEALDSETRLGLSYQEFRKTREHRGAVVVSPIQDRAGARYLGCVSVDAPGDCYERLTDVRVFEALQTVARTVAPHIT